jgi:hypothetical protein
MDVVTWGGDQHLKTHLRARGNAPNGSEEAWLKPFRGMVLSESKVSIDR